MPSNSIARTSESPIKSKNTPPKKVFNPTPSMFIWLETVMKTDTHEVQKISDTSGIDESTYYRWLKQDGFIDWFEEQRQSRLKAFSWRLDNMGMKKAVDDFRYWEGMQKRVGNFKETNNIAAEFKDGDKSMRFVISREA